MIIHKVFLPGHITLLAPVGTEMVVTIAGFGTHSIRVEKDVVTVAHSLNAQVTLTTEPGVEDDKA